MAKDKLTDYSATNASYTDVGGVNIDEGMLPSDVNNAIREVMTHLKEFEDGTNGITKLSAIDAEITGTGAIKVPVGTTAQRPTPATGQLRFNSTDSSFEGYDGSAWGAIGGGAENSFTVFEYTATASQTTFSGADDNAATLSYTAGNIQVMLNGVVLDPSDYTATNGTSVVLASGAALNDVLNIYAFTSFSVADTVSASTGGTFSANVAFAADATFGDNDKAVFGAGDDLQIYHDGSNSYIDETISTGVGSLIIRANNLLAQNSLDEPYFQGITNGAFRIYYDGSTKLATTASGIDVTGSVTADGVESTCAAGDGNLALQAYHPTSTSARDIAKFQSNVGGTQEDKVVIKCDGNVGIGQSSPTSVLHLKPDSDSSSGGLALESENGTHKWTIDANNAGNLRFYKGITAVGRFDSSGNLLVGVTQNPDGSDTGIGLLSNGNFNQTKGSNMMNLYRGGTGSVVTFRQGTIGGSFTSVGTISVTGSATAYNTSSDYRLKENVTADWDATTRLKQLNPVRFNFIAEPDTTVDGFLAHEVQDIVPEAISGTKDEVDDDGNAVMQGIDQSKLVPLLVKTIQELEARVAALESA